MKAFLLVLLGSALPLFVNAQCSKIQAKATVPAKVTAGSTFYLDITIKAPHSRDTIDNAVIQVRCTDPIGLGLDTVLPKKGDNDFKYTYQNRGLDIHDFELGNDAAKYRTFAVKINVDACAPAQDLIFTVIGLLEGEDEADSCDFFSTDLPVTIKSGKTTCAPSTGPIINV